MIGYDEEEIACPTCGGEGSVIDCCDDLCHGMGYCMHGDERDCPECHGEGFVLNRPPREEDAG